MGLDNEAVGAWTRAMMYLWTNGPTPAERIQQVAGNGWERVAFLFVDFGGKIGLQWQEDLREKQRIFREKASSFGTQGGRPSKAKKGTLSEKKGYLKGTQRVRSMKNEDEERRIHKEEHAGAKVIATSAQAVHAEEFPFSSPQFLSAWDTWEKARKEGGKPIKPTARALQMKKCQEMGEQRAIAALMHSASNGYQGLFEPTQPRTNGQQSITDKAREAIELLRFDGL
jgi:hypothetical protein